MVSKTEEEQVNRLENQVENGGGGAWEYLCLVRKLKLRRADKVLKYGFSVLNDPSKRSALGPEEWTLYEQVAIAAMDCQRLDLAKEFIKVLQRKFPESKRVEAEKAHSSLLEDNQFDQVIHKRRVAMAKAQGNLAVAIEWLNKYLEIFMADHDAWRELAEIYVSLQMYKQAAFCYEELILSQPTVPLYHLAYADVLYTLGGLENLHAAKKYYAAAIDLTGGKNIRALFGICLCYVISKALVVGILILTMLLRKPVFSVHAAIGQLTKGRNKEDKESLELQSLSAQALEKAYKQLSPAKLSLLTSTLRSLKVSL
ncbi:UNVERIFIED_CONTAM: ER membrane protein complex subunit [Sesamum angustifolium]|uniref:ER membrane protein complex subunit 2 n=1 Tax=Sesamum angustifolium TaxID=2727405 RepID=A0AAW2IWU5_9LAMI